jgi:biopolymer transport protein ExbB/TolQ
VFVVVFVVMVVVVMLVVFILMMVGVGVFHLFTLLAAVSRFDDVDIREITYRESLEDSS